MIYAITLDIKANINIEWISRNKFYTCNTGVEYTLYYMYETCITGVLHMYYMCMNYMFDNLKYHTCITCASHM